MHTYATAWQKTKPPGHKYLPFPEDSGRSSSERDSSERGLQPALLKEEWRREGLKNTSILRWSLITIENINVDNFLFLKLPESWHLDFIDLSSKSKSSSSINFVLCNFDSKVKSAFRTQRSGPRFSRKAIQRRFIPEFTFCTRGLRQEYTSTRSPCSGSQSVGCWVTPSQFEEFKCRSISKKSGTTQS